MKIIKKSEPNPNVSGEGILNTELEDDKGNKIVIDTCVLGGEGAMLDAGLEGKNTTGEIEMMVELNGYWVNNSQKRYPDRETAIKDHKEIIKKFEKNGVNEILKFNEVYGAGKSFSEEQDKLKEMIKVEE